MKNIVGENNMKLSDKIRIIRKARGFSQEGLGYNLSKNNSSGISRQAVSDWENGKSEPKLDNIRDLAEVLNVSFDALLDESIDLEDKDVLTQVLTKSTNIETKDTTKSFSYSIYVNKLSWKSFVRIGMVVILLLMTLTFVLLQIYLKGYFYAFAIVSGGMSLGFSGIAAIDLRDIIKGNVRAKIGSLTNKYLTLTAYEKAFNQLVIPVEKILKIEIGGNQKKRSGDVLFTIEGRNRPITVFGVSNPNELLEVYDQLKYYLENDIVKFV